MLANLVQCLHHRQEGDKRSDFHREDARLCENTLSKWRGNGQHQIGTSVSIYTYSNTREEDTLDLGKIDCLTEIRHRFQSSFLYLHQFI
jgi:hypothetical protein